MISAIPPPNPFFERMGAHLCEVMTEMFAALECPVSLSTSAAELPPDERAGVAAIGYVGEKVRGVLLLSASEFAIERWMECMGVTDCDIGDALGEFANMLLGRLKARLLKEGLPISLAIPTATIGVGLRFSVPPPHSMSFVFQGPGWTVRTRLHATFEAGFALEERASELAAEAGRVVLF